MLMIRGLIRSLLQVGFFAAVLLIPAGTWRWPRALQFLLALWLLSSAAVVALARFRPASLEARVQRGAAKNQPTGDRVASLLLAIFIIAWFVFIAVDVQRLHLLPSPPLWLAILGAAIGMSGYGLIFAAVWQNPYAAPIVGDQSEREQVLVDTGAYGLIRHPLYLGFLLMLAGLALWLESLAGLLVLPAAFAPVIGRIAVEERTLREVLPGYTEYAIDVPYRLVPFVW